MERVMSELAWHFSSKQKIEIHLVLYGISREIFYPVPETVIIHKPAFTFNNDRRFYSTVRTLFYLRGIIKKLKPYSILSFGEYWNSYLLLALLGLNSRVFVSDRCQPDKSLGKFHDLLRKILYRKSAGIIVQTSAAKEIYQAMISNENIQVIGNPIRSILTGGSNAGRENIVLTVGRLIMSKHHDKLIELFLKISKPGWKLVIVGYDHLKQEVSLKLKKIIEENNAGDTVILAGKQKNTDEYYLKSRIFAFTSSSEGFPNVIGEAMSAGLPVVSFDCIAGPSEMIADNINGFLIPLFDFDLFQKKLEYLMDNDEIRFKMGDKAKDDIKKFSIERIGEQYLKVLLS